MYIQHIFSMITGTVRITETQVCVRKCSRTSLVKVMVAAVVEEAVEHRIKDLDK